MMISKTATDITNGYQPIYYYQNARSSFAEILNYYNQKMQSTLLLPGYIGFSPKEGSGIYDPVIETGISHSFYPLNKQLYIDIEKFEKLLNSITGNIIVLLVHYFGYPDKNLKRIVALCRSKKVMIIEDAAHGLYTDFVDHNYGQYGDYVLYSLHKMLPFESGGMLKINTPIKEFQPKLNILFKKTPFSYDFYYISRRRKRNAQLWNELLKDYRDFIEIIRPYSKDVTPQTFPILLKKFDRNELYFKLNEAGYGAVSLYHTMIKPMHTKEFESSVWVSQHIINMPVHQDADENEIRKMCEMLLSIIM